MLCYDSFFLRFWRKGKVNEFYERVSGARFHANFIRPGGISQDIPENLLEDISLFITNFYNRLNEIEDVLNSNRIWAQRLLDIVQCHIVMH